MDPRERFELQVKIGQGGYGYVCKAFDTINRKMVKESSICWAIYVIDSPCYEQIPNTVINPTLSNIFIGGN